MNCKFSMYIFSKKLYIFKRDTSFDILSFDILSKLEESYISGEIKLIA